MISFTKAFRREIFENRRNYLTYADITLSNNTVLNLTNEELWSGGFRKEDAVSEDDSFTALGSTIIGSATIAINNMDDAYSGYDFMNATVVTYIALELGEGQSAQLEKVKMGTYTVDAARYNGSIITLELLDNMEQFDRPYSSSTLVYPATLYEIIADACTKCSVTLDTSSLTFPHYNYHIATRPEDGSITFREVVGWAAAIAGCFARCNRDGKLELKWFDQATLEDWDEGENGGIFDSSTPYYSTGDALAGGTFNPWNDGDAADGGDFTTDAGMHYIAALYSQDISMDDVVITGVQITVKDESDNATSDTVDYLSGSGGYVICIRDNGLLTKTNAQEVVTWLGTQLIGLTFRKASVTHANDPSIEAGDIGVLFDRKNGAYPILITRTNFAVGNTQTTVCGAETPSRNSATRYGWETKSYVESRKLLKKQKTTYDTALENLAAALNAHSGLYSTVEGTQSGNIFYLHDKPLLADSTIVWKMNSGGWAVTTNYDGASTVWTAGLTVDGTFLASVIQTISAFFDYARGGTLTLGGNNNINGLLRILNAAGTEIGRWDNTGATITGTLSAMCALSGGAVYHTVGEYRHYYSTSNYWNYTGIDMGYKSGNTVSRYLRLNFNDNSTIYAESNKSLKIDSNYSNGSYGGQLLLSSDESLLLNNDYFGIDITYDSTDGNIVYLGSTDFSASQGMIVIGEDFITINAGMTGSADNEVHLYGDFTVYGDKHRKVITEDYSGRYLYSYELASPMFGDVGEGRIADDGTCYIQIDPILLQTINTNRYQVFLQKYGEGDCYVKERHGSYFVVSGTVGLEFGWELKAKQFDAGQKRLESSRSQVRFNNGINYADDAVNHIQDIQREREGETE